MTVGAGMTVFCPIVISLKPLFSPSNCHSRFQTVVLAFKLSFSRRRESTMQMPAFAGRTAFCPIVIFFQTVVRSQTVVLSQTVILAFKPSFSLSNRHSRSQTVILAQARISQPKNHPNSITQPPPHRPSQPYQPASCHPCKYPRCATPDLAHHLPPSQSHPPPVPHPANSATSSPPTV